MDQSQSRQSQKAERSMKYHVVNTVNKQTKLTRLYEYDVLEPEQVKPLLEKHNNDSEFVAAYKVIDHEASV